MAGEELFLTKIAAIGQVLGAIATFIAVAVSLAIASRSRKPAVRLIVGKRLLIEGGKDDDEILAFHFANIGERHVEITAVGWKTGWFRRGPNWLKTQTGLQITGGAGFGAVPPFKLPPATSSGTYALLQNATDQAAKRQSSPFFTRDFPILGRLPTRMIAFAETADGYTFKVRPEPSLRKALSAAEIAAKAG
jgi:hypothetical protein